MVTYADVISAAFTFILIGSHIRKASMFSMLTTGQMFVFNSDEEVTLQCEFHMERFDLFYHPVLWQKIQYHEATEMNIMGNMKEPFASTKKFSVYFNPSPPKYTMGLTIRNLSLEDSGNYTCEVRAPGSELLGRVTHRIFVRAHVIDVAVYQDTTTSRIDEYHMTPPVLILVEETPTPIKCVAEGGNPPPDVEMLMGRRDVTHLFHVQTYPTLSGEKGFRLMQMTTMIWSDYFRATAADDKKRLKCKVTVAGLGSRSAVAVLEVHYAPTIFCSKPEAYLGDTNLYLSCEVKARPGVTSLYWELDSNGTVVTTEGTVVNGEYWIINMDQGNNVIQSQLFLREVREDSFRTYKLVAENAVAFTTRNVELVQLHDESPSKPHLVTGHELKSHYVSDSRNKPNTGYVFIRGSTSDASRHFGSHVEWILISIGSICLERLIGL